MAKHDHIRLKLQHLLERGSLSQELFPAEFEDFTGGDRRQAMKWLHGEATPSKRSRAHLAKFFSIQFAVEVPQQLFLKESSVEQLKSWCEDHYVSPQKKISFELQAPVGALGIELTRDLKGSYYIYRYSFHDNIDRPRLIRDVLLVDASENGLFLDLELHVFPAVGGARQVEAGVDVAMRDELFIGRLYSFGTCFYGVLSHSDGNRDNRIRHILFPHTSSRAFTYFGLISGFATTLTEPVAVKAIIDKTNHSPQAWKERDVDMLRRYDPSHPDVKKYAELIDNHIAEKSSVLTVNKEASPYKSLCQATINTLGLPEDVE